MLSHFIPFQWPKSDIFGDGVFDKTWMAFEVGLFFSLFQRGCFWRDKIRTIYGFGVVFGLFFPCWPTQAPGDTMRVTESCVGSSLLQGTVSGEGGTCREDGASCVRSSDLLGRGGMSIKQFTN